MGQGLAGATVLNRTVSRRLRQLETRLKPIQFPEMEIQFINVNHRVVRTLFIGKGRREWIEAGNDSASSINEGGMADLAGNGRF